MRHDVREDRLLIDGRHWLVDPRLVPGGVDQRDRHDDHEDEKQSRSRDDQTFRGDRRVVFGAPIAGGSQ